MYLNLTPQQIELVKKHGLPMDFAKACYRAVPEFISMDEARDAISVYCEEWQKARKSDPT